MDNSGQIFAQHALDLITASAHRWLIHKGWEINQTQSGCEYFKWSNRGDPGEFVHIKCELIDALVFEMDKHPK